MVTRWGAMAPYLEDHVANLRRGLQGSRVAVRSGVLKVIEQIDDLAVKEVEAWPLLKPLADPHGKWKAADRTALRDGLTSAVRDRVRPAFLRLGDVLRTEILPQARPDERPGLMHVPGGTAAYRRLIHSYTALDLSPDELLAAGAVLHQHACAGDAASVRGRGPRVPRVDPRTSFANRHRATTRGPPSVPKAPRGDGVHGGMGPLHGAPGGRDGPVYRGPRPDRGAVLRRMARVPARGRHGHAREGLHPEPSDRVHPREHRPRGEQQRERGGPLHRRAG